MAFPMPEDAPVMRTVFNMCRLVFDLKNTKPQHKKSGRHFAGAA
jgi:hypothetical protein